MQQKLIIRIPVAKEHIKCFTAWSCRCCCLDGSAFASCETLFTLCRSCRMRLVTQPNSVHCYVCDDLLGGSQSRFKVSPKQGHHEDEAGERIGSGGDKIRFSCSVPKSQRYFVFSTQIRSLAALLSSWRSICPRLHLA